jgi:hypothetical protein
MMEFDLPASVTQEGSIFSSGTTATRSGSGGPRRSKRYAIGAKSTPRTPKAAPEQTGAYVPPVDVSTLGSGSGVLPSPMAFVPPDWDKDPFVQFIGGGLGGLCLGAVPFAGVGQQFLDAAHVLPHGTLEARLGLALGEIAGASSPRRVGLLGKSGVAR